MTAIEAPAPGSSLRAALARSDGSVVIAELVPWRGVADDIAGGRARQLASDLHVDQRFTAVSITDNAGGHAMLSPEVLAGELAAQHQQTIVHVACRDRNRNELLSLGWRLAGAGLENVLVLSGDYPTEGFLGVARPVFDVDSVGLLELYRGMNEGRIGDAVIGRPIPRDRDARVAGLTQPRGAASSARTDLHLGVAVNPFKIVERDQVPQYLKLERKVRTGATYAITQVGFDIRKLHELVRVVADRALPVHLIANVYLLARGTARMFASGGVPGISLPTSLLERAEREAAAADKGKAFFLDLAARQVAIARGLGYAGVYLGGATRAADFARILDLAEGYGTGWEALVADASFLMPDTWYAYEPDPSSGLNGPARVPLSTRGTGALGGAPIAYRLNRALHALAFDPASPGAKVARPAVRLRRAPSPGPSPPRARAGSQDPAVRLPGLRRLLAARRGLPVPREPVRQEPTERALRWQPRGRVRDPRQSLHLGSGVRAACALRRDRAAARSSAGDRRQLAAADERVGQHVSRP